MSSLQEFKERELAFRIEELTFRREELAFRKEEFAYRMLQENTPQVVQRPKYQPTGEESVKNFSSMFGNSSHIENAKKNDASFRQTYAGTAPYRRDDGYVG